MLWIPKTIRNIPKIFYYVLWLKTFLSAAIKTTTKESKTKIPSISRMGYVVHLLMQFSSSVKQTTNQRRELSHPDLWLAKSLNRVLVFSSTSFMFTFVGYRAPRSSQPRPRARHASNINNTEGCSLSVTHR